MYKSDFFRDRKNKYRAAAIACELSGMNIIRGIEEFNNNLYITLKDVVHTNAYDIFHFFISFVSTSINYQFSDKERIIIEDLNVKISDKMEGEWRT